VSKTAAVKGVVVGSVRLTSISVPSQSFATAGTACWLIRQNQTKNKTSLVVEHINVLQNETSNNLDRRHFLSVILLKPSQSADVEIVFAQKPWFLRVPARTGEAFPSGSFLE
jgi:hypothetical protein